MAFGRLFCGWACPQTIFMEMMQGTSKRDHYPHCRDVIPRKGH
jgi:polyferredoxin